jgi:hypothetical protein
MIVMMVRVRLFIRMEVGILESGRLIISMDWDSLLPTIIKK